MFTVPFRKIDPMALDPVNMGSSMDWWAWERSIVVFDLGGSKLDVSILTVSDGLIDV